MAKAAKTYKTLAGRCLGLDNLRLSARLYAASLCDLYIFIGSR